MVEWRDLFSHDDLRGKVLLGYTGLLRFNRTKAPLLFTYVVHYFATGSGAKCVDHLDPKGPVISCYAT